VPGRGIYQRTGGTVQVTATAAAYLTVSRIATDLGIRRGKVLGWISRGGLPAINIADRASGRPRWRIARSAFDDFLAGRTCRTPEPPARRTRVNRKADPAFVKYF
jgi:excisionase family DNA binding protein